jgi:hypothetical protein
MASNIKWGVASALEAIIMACAPRPKDDVRRITDAEVLASTGKNWDEWFAVLDGMGVEEKGHTHAVRFLQEHHALDEKWAERVARRFEEDRGLRSLTT